MILVFEELRCLVLLFLFRAEFSTGNNVVEIRIEPGSSDAVSWKSLELGGVKECIRPPPFGRQCTAYADNALIACLRLQGCLALVCPAPKQVHTKSLAGKPICQARSHTDKDEVRHPMCRGHLGCTHLTLFSHNGTSLDDFRSQGGLLLLPSPSSTQKKTSPIVRSLLQSVDPTWRFIDPSTPETKVRAVEVPPLLPPL